MTWLGSVQYHFYIKLLLLKRDLNLFLLPILHARDHGVTKCFKEVGQPHLATTASVFMDNGCPSLTISCSAASAPQQHSWGRCSSFSGGCSTHGPEELRLKTYDTCQYFWTIAENYKHLLAASYLRPIITGSICKDVAIVVEAASRDGLVKLLRGLQLGAGIFVPEAEASIWAHSSQCAMDRMEGNGIHLMEENRNQYVSHGETLRLSWLVH